MRENYKRLTLAILFLVMALILTSCDSLTGALSGDQNTSGQSVDYEEIPEYSGSPYVVLNGNVPVFEIDTAKASEHYSRLDSLGRCGAAEAVLGKELMPKEDRQDISEVYPSGFENKDYGDLVNGGYLYNRSHLIAFQLAGENANERNLITGTQYMNQMVMTPFENLVADYIKDTGNHVKYRVTPIFEGKNLVASGVTMEAKSVEDDGDAICFNVYCYNVQPGIDIDYRTGDSRKVSNQGPDKDLHYTNAGYYRCKRTAIFDGEVGKEVCRYVLNTNTMKIHDPSCKSIQRIKDYNIEYSNEELEILEKQGYSRCQNCLP